MTIITVDLMAAAFDQLNDRIAIIDASGLILCTNQRWKDLNASVSVDTTIDAESGNYLDAYDTAGARGDIWAMSASTGIRRVLAKMTPDFKFDYPLDIRGSNRWFHMVINPIDHPAGTYFVVSHQDITQAVDARVKLSKMAGTNLITGAPEWQVVDQFIVSELMRCRRQSAPISLALIKMDHYQSLRNAHGVLFADECLVEVLKQLTTITRRPSDIVGHFETSVFVMVLGGTDSAAAEDIVRSVQDQARKIAVLDVNGAEVNPVSLTCGLGSILPEGTMNCERLYDLSMRQLVGAEALGLGTLQTAAHP